MEDMRSSRTHMCSEVFHAEWIHRAQLVLLRLTNTLRYMIMETKERHSVSRLGLVAANDVQSSPLKHWCILGDWVALRMALKASLWRPGPLMCALTGVYDCATGELTWPSGSRCSSLWCTDRSVCRPDRSLWRLCEYPADIWGHRLSLGTETHRVRRMEKQWYSLSVLRMTMHSSCWQTQHASKGSQPLFHTWKPGYGIRGKMPASCRVIWSIRFRLPGLKSKCFIWEERANELYF